MSDRDYENGDYWHRACRDCQHEFSGPKREFLCAICRPVRDSKQPAPLAATHSEDGREAPEVVAWIMKERLERLASGWSSTVYGPAWAERHLADVESEPLMTVAQHERIVAEKDAEIARLCKLAYIGEHQFEDCTYKFRLEELRAQSARQVGGDERETFRKAYWDKKNGPIGHMRPLEAAEWAWMTRAALAPAAVAVVMPDRRAVSEASREQAMCANSFNAALDAVARLNRRAIPAGLLERMIEVLEYEGCNYALELELRALLGKEGE